MASQKQSPVPVVIHSFRSPASIWASEDIWDGMSLERRKLMELEMKIASEVSRKKDLSSPRQPDQLVAVQCPEDQRKWVRGRILDVLQLIHGPKYEVVLIDRGNKVRVKPDRLRNLPYKCDELPPQAMNIVLEGVVPVKLGISSTVDAMNPEVSLDWTNRADAFVNMILSEYTAAWFVVDANHSAINQTYFGDLLIEIDKNRESLTNLLIQNGHAKCSSKDFEKRIKQEKAANKDGGEINHSPSILSWDESSSSCAPSPSPVTFVSIPESSTPIQQRRTIQDVLNSKQAQKLVSPQDVPERSEAEGNMEPLQPVSKNDNGSKPLSKTTRLSLLVARLKSPETTNKTEETSNKNTEEVVLNKQDPGYLEIPLPAVSRRLDERFIPAGKLIVKEKKSTTGVFEKRNQSPKENLNHRSGDCSSDSSFSDHKTETSMPLKAKDLLNSAGDSCDSSSDSPLSMNGSHKLTSILKKLKNSPTKQRSEVKLSASENIKTEHIQSNPSSARDRILSIAKVDDSTEVEDYLARSILLHGGFPPSPWMTYDQLKSKFSTHVEQLLIDRRWCYSILSLEKFMWPAIQQRQNVIMISPPKTGKTFSYIIPLMDFMIDAEDIPKGNGPMVLILCPGSQAAVEVYESCVKVVNGAKKAPRVQVVYGEEISSSTIYKLVNGCEVLITTPPCFLRLISNVKYVKGFAINLKRLCHYVLDKADILMMKFLNEMKEIQALVVGEQESRTLKHDPIQIIVASEQWEPHFPSYTKHLRGNPLLCINNCFEACVYGKPQVSFHVTQSKPTKLLQVLKHTAGLNKVVVFCEEQEIDILEKILRNECMDILVTRPNHSLQQLNSTLLHWRSSKEGQHYTLLCTDCEFIDLKVQDAMCVIHYSFPTVDKSIFVRRLSAILLNLPNIFEKRVQGKSPSIQLILDDSNIEQLPVTVQLMHRISNDIPQSLMKLAEVVRKEREKMQKMNRTFCLNLKMFGECSKSICPSRHVFVPELDETQNLPLDGLVKVRVSQVRNAGHFSARLKEHTQLDGTTVKWPSQYTQISTMMYDYFSKQQNRKLVDSGKVAIKDIYAIETIQDLFHRVEILEVLEKDKYGNPSFVQVKFLEEGEQKNIKVHCLYSLPEELKVIPAQSVDVFLCGLLPGDLDDSYDIHATACVKQLIQYVEDSSEDVFIQGKVVFSMTGSLWLDPVGVCEWLSNMGTKVVHNNIKRTLLELGHAVPNPNHLPKLFALCGKQLSEPTVNEVSNVCEPLPEADWAFLEREMSDEVEFICAETVESVTLFYVQRTKFKPLLTNLIDEINKDSSKRKEEEVLLLCPGDICLARYEDKWHRAKILSRHENSATVFYVDYGDGGTVSLEEIKSIPSWAVTKLPFQAIECSLAGISTLSCDLLYEITDDGAKELYAQVCECKAAKTTGGKHFLVALIDSLNGSILNTDLLKLEGVERCEDELKYLDFQIDEILYRNNSSAESNLDETSIMKLDEADIVNLDDPNIINPDDLGFKEEDLSYLPDEYDDEGVDLMDGFEVNGIEEFLKSSNISKIAEKALTDACGSGITETSKSCQTPAECLVPQDQASGKMTGNQQKKGKNSEEKNNGADDDDLSDWGEGGNFVGRCRLPVLCNARPPRTKWIEDLYYVWIKICITGVRNYFLHWTHDTFQFSTTDGGRHYLIDQKLRGTIIPCSVKSSIKGFTVEVKMKKALSGVDWGMPFACQRKLPWVSRDIESTADVSSESDCDISIGTINKEIRKLPLKMRRKRVPKHMQESVTKPDIDSSGDNSNCEHEQIDSDEMF